DLPRGQAAEQPQRQRDLRVDGERRMAAGEDEREPLVRDRAHSFLLFLLRSDLREQRQLRFEPAVTAQAVNRAVLRSRDDPGAGIRRDAVSRPALRGDRERLLDGVLGEVEVPERADQDRDSAPELLPECLGDRVRGYSSKTTTGRTSIEPCCAPGMR